MTRWGEGGEGRGRSRGSGDEVGVGSKRGLINVESRDSAVLFSAAHNTTLMLTNTTDVLYNGNSWVQRMRASRSYDYPVRLSPDDNNSLMVTFPDFPEAHTLGKTKDEALARAVDALATVVDVYIRERRPIPLPSTGRLIVSLPALMASKVALYETMRAQNIGKAELARRLDWHLPQVDRLLDLRHASRLDQLEAAFRALGQRVIVSTAALNTPASAVTRRALRPGIGHCHLRRPHGPRKRRATAR